ncbi:hypothetical protein GCM10010124_01720 [Pilimelia terevasa]|uniref:Methyltransferase domain-containing protein n=1 Tax=Pilimelia terevasa TaxID=53372 RepID=A0A8J3BIK3_9ACTN|nr:SAM-dependent methyltransferase [Pilimelia terevasa]GGK12827.1 hypothetical protein GCM10010124_01720 [Pilimelia terevasa]
MPQSLDAALTEVRAALLHPALVRAVAAGRRRGQPLPDPARAQVRPVALKAGARLQVVGTDGVRPHTRNVAPGADAAAAVDALLAQPYGNWHVETADTVLQVRVTKKGEAQVHRDARAPVSAEPAAHDRASRHLLDPGDPLFAVVGGGAAKRRQVDAFLRALDATLPAEGLPTPLRVVDLGCGNAYLTFAAYRYLHARGIAAEVTGVDVREDQRERNTALAAALGCAGQVRFVAGTIAAADLDPPHVVLALHACDTATDEALARAVAWQARWILAAPCCHHDVAAQLRRAPAGPLTRDGILRERLADTLTDALRAALLRERGYAVDVVEFVDSAHTPRNTLLRCRRAAGARPAEAAGLAAAYGVNPALAAMLGAAGAGGGSAPGLR